jgi:hypothetical protein
VGVPDSVESALSARRLSRKFGAEIEKKRRAKEPVQSTTHSRGDAISPGLKLVEEFQERLAKLAGGVAVIRVGAATEVEMKEKKARVEDAMHATRLPPGSPRAVGAVMVSADEELTDDHMRLLQWLDAHPTRRRRSGARPGDHRCRDPLS